MDPNQPGSPPPPNPGQNNPLLGGFSPQQSGYPVDPGNQPSFDAPDPGVPPQGASADSGAQQPDQPPVYVPPPPPVDPGPGSGYPGGFGTETPPAAPYGAPPASPYGAPPATPYGAPLAGTPPTAPYGTPPQAPYGVPPQGPYGPIPGIGTQYGQPGYLPPGMSIPGMGRYGRYGRGGGRRSLASCGLSLGIFVVFLVITGAIHGIHINSGDGAVFSDNMTDPSSGWPTDALSSGTQPSITSSGYVVSAKGQGDIAHFFGAPYDTTVESIRVDATATQAAGAGPSEGWGVSCVRGDDDASQVRYDFRLETSGAWEIVRSTGPTSSADSKVVAQGTSQTDAGPQSSTVEGSCGVPNLNTTTLVMKINGTTVDTVNDESPVDVSDEGWSAAVDVITSDSVPSTVTFTNFEIFSS